MLGLKALSLREIIEWIIARRAPAMRPEDREAFAALLVAELFQLDLYDLRDGRRGRMYSASELLDQAKDVLDTSERTKDVYYNLLLRMIHDLETRCADTSYEYFGAWVYRISCDVTPSKPLRSEAWISRMLLIHRTRQDEREEAAE
ncbi:hypothetical protein [Pseudomonas sp.]|uniref:hypothetical protein n=1 Tax=Pseudomonas sp. TaxID=306 RepID=UPI003242CDE1